MHRFLKSLIGASFLALSFASPVLLPLPALAADTAVTVQHEKIAFRSEVIDGVKVAYREAGDP